MSGKPAARLTDNTLKGGPIVQGSLTVLIGSQGGIACAPCPGGKAVGSPVNPVLGAKFLDGGSELDVALPGPLAFVWQRQYSSYVNLKEGARCGLHGYGWGSPFDLALEHGAGEVKLYDTRGRTIVFDEALPPGGTLYSASEDIWIVRGGGNRDAEAHWSKQARFARLNPNWVGNAEVLFAASGGVDSAVWCFAPPSLAATGELPTTLYQPARERYEDLRHITQAIGRCALYRIVDPLGREQRLHRNEAQQLVGVTDPLGRTVGFVYTQVHAGREAQGAWQADRGLRLAALVLSQAGTGTGTGTGTGSHGLAPITPSALGRDEHGRIVLARYHYDRHGDLIEVDRREGAGARRYGYMNHLMTGHSSLGDTHENTQQDDTGLNVASNDGDRPVAHTHQYRYEHDEAGARVLEQINRGALSYRFEYHYAVEPAEPTRPATAATPNPNSNLNPNPNSNSNATKPLPRHTHTTVTDSLGRREVY